VFFIRYRFGTAALSLPYRNKSPLYLIVIALNSTV
jgi:hypothetical protein